MRRHLLGLLLVITLLTVAAQAAPADFALVVTHASTLWDPAASAAAGVQCTIEQARRNGVPTFYLVHEEPAKIEEALLRNAKERAGNACGYYLKYPGPTKYLHSASGNHGMRFPAPNLFLTGGYFEGCLKNTLAYLLLHSPQAQLENLRVHYVMDAVYTGRNDEHFVTLLARLLESPGDPLEALSSGVANPLEFVRTWLLSLRGLRAADWETLFSFVIQRSGKQVGVLGRGPHRIMLDFIESREVPDLLR